MKCGALLSLLASNTLFSTTFCTQTHFQPAQMSWHSEFAGWHSRAQPHTSPDSFSPTRDNLVLGVVRSAPAQPNGFTLALFSPDIAVDAMGRVSVLSADDFAGLNVLARGTINLPDTGSFRNTWRVKQTRTSQPIERLLVPTSDSALREVSVQGYDKEKRDLSAPVTEYTQLPDTLWELFGLIAESREGYERGQEDVKLIGRVKELLVEE
ncbi:hypothetical protein PHLGIDRAFT_18604 [Phlebiopsis gigantea 11061_1 CR5-6]|uniref:NADH:ubiquinone oxidoreductase intermediate-associated protein 30 domain-containing protein n=1 Tax=Phlebiopsis gigantea (strain 11061_1 CR5-6) TaxID=745531 RepID=A0A0C3PQR8_PHLG1|nr:hypothetical protein PHLGIDRAFT_18604 [Phlebiopsis gigantea 11061_1 CR5-6]